MPPLSRARETLRPVRLTDSLCQLQNLTDIVLAQQHIWFVIPLLPMAVVFFVSGLAETNRAPFNLAEGESELVAGFHVEYSAMTWAAVLHGRIRQHDHGQRDDLDPVSRRLAGAVQHRAVHGVLGACLGDCLAARARSCSLMFLFLWVRATFPRFRYDQLMRLGWKVFLPLSLFWLVLTNWCQTMPILPVFADSADFNCLIRQ